MQTCSTPSRTAVYRRGAVSIARPTPVPMRAPDTGWPVATPTPVPMSPPATVAHPEMATAINRMTNSCTLFMMFPGTGRFNAYPSLLWFKQTQTDSTRRVRVCCALHRLGNATRKTESGVPGGRRLLPTRPDIRPLQQRTLACQGIWLGAITHHRTIKCAGALRAARLPRRGRAFACSASSWTRPARAPRTPGRARRAPPKAARAALPH